MLNNKKGKIKLHENEEVSVGTAQMRKKSNVNKFSQMMTRNKKSNEEQAGSRRNSREQTPVTDRDQGILPTNLSQNDVASNASDVVSGDVDMRRKSIESVTTERELMELDNDYFDNNLKVSTTPQGLVSATTLTKKEFNYTMGLFNAKITSLYKLCKYISNKQQENSKALKRLVVFDELSEGF